MGEWPSCCRHRYECNGDRVAIMVVLCGHEFMVGAGW